MIVEMFCIGLYARHTFRKMEPSVAEDVEVPISIWQVDKAIQTDDAQTIQRRPAPLSEEAHISSCLTGANNLSYDGTSEESLCRIEHAPLDGFSFPQARRPMPGRRRQAESTPTEESGTEVTHVTVRADINYQESKDATVV